MKKLVLYTESSNHVGGQELQALIQLDTFRTLGFDILLACRPESQIKAHALAMNIPVFPIAFRNSSHVPSLWQMRQLIRQRQPVFIVSHSGHDSNITALAAKTLWERPFLLRQKTYLTGKIKPFSTRYLVDRVIVPSAGMKRTMIAGGCDDHDISVVAPGFDFATLLAESQQPLPEHLQHWLAHDSRPVIAQVGMLRSEKGHDTALAALAALKRAGYAFRYLIVGGGALEEEIRAAVTYHGLEQDVMMAGKVFPASAIYPYADLLLMPSRNESFGMALVEAMFFKVPVMASAVGGIPDVIRPHENGVLLPPGDVDAWQAAIADFLTHPARYRQHAQSAAEEVRQRYASETCVRNILALAERHPPQLLTGVNASGAN